MKRKKKYRVSNDDICRLKSPNRKDDYTAWTGTLAPLLGSK